MKKISVIAVGLVFSLAACGQPASEPAQKNSGSYRYFIPAKLVEPSSKSLSSRTAPRRNGIIDLIV